MNRPNFLFISTDQQNISAMGAYGNPHLETPNMDRIAAAGVRFTNSYCTSPLCSPARASFLTGLFPHRTGVKWNHASLKPGLPQLGEFLRHAGYDTAWVGKWHVPGEYPVSPDAIPGFENLPILGRTTEGGDYPVKVAGRDDGWKHNLGVYVDEPVAKTAAAFLRRAHRGPFMLAVSLMNPHDICFPSEHFRAGPVRDSDLPPLPANFGFDPEEPELLINTRFTHEGSSKIAEQWDERGWREAMRIYYRFTQAADKAVGIVLDALEESGLERDTVIIYTSDHGEGNASHRWFGKLSLYEESAAVPFIVSRKDATPAGEADTERLVSACDILPTILGYAGIEQPAGLDGQDLGPLIRDKSLRGREYVGCALYPVWEKSNLEGRMIRTRQFKYTVFSPGARPEMLFDLRQDPGETRNLARDPHFCAELEKHRAMLKDWISRTEDSFVTPA